MKLIKNRLKNFEVYAREKIISLEGDIVTEYIKSELILKGDIQPVSSNLIENIQGIKENNIFKIITADRVSVLYRLQYDGIFYEVLSKNAWISHYEYLVKEVK